MGEVSSCFRQSTVGCACIIHAPNCCRESLHQLTTLLLSRLNGSKVSARPIEVPSISLFPLHRYHTGKTLSEAYFTPIISRPPTVPTAAIVSDRRCPAGVEPRAAAFFWCGFWCFWYVHFLLGHPTIHQRTISNSDNRDTVWCSKILLIYPNHCLQRILSM